MAGMSVSVQVIDLRPKSKHNQLESAVHQGDEQALPQCLPFGKGVLTLCIKLAGHMQEIRALHPDTRLKPGEVWLDFPWMVSHLMN